MFLLYIYVPTAIVGRVKIYHCQRTFSQAYDVNELWHFPRRIIILSRRCDYRSSGPTETSRIRRIGLLLLGGVSLKILTCSGATLLLRVLAC